VVEMTLLRLLTYGIIAAGILCFCLFLRWLL
jgi:hypothetical protein